MSSCSGACTAMRACGQVVWVGRAAIRAGRRTRGGCKLGHAILDPHCRPAQRLQPTCMRATRQHIWSAASSARGAGSRPPACQGSRAASASENAGGCGHQPQARNSRASAGSRCRRYARRRGDSSAASGPAAAAACRATQVSGAAPGAAARRAAR